MRITINQMEIESAIKNPEQNKRLPGSLRFSVGLIPITFLLAACARCFQIINRSNSSIHLASDD